MAQQVRLDGKSCRGGAERGGDCHFDCASAYDIVAEIGVWLEAILRYDTGGWYAGTCIRPTSLRTGFRWSAPVMRMQ
jgi:hypothetical protein